MAFFDEVLTQLGLDRIALTAGYQVMDFNGQAIYVEGVRRVLQITDTEIVLGIGKKGTLTVTGSELLVSELSDGAVTVKGKVDAFSAVQA